MDFEHLEPTARNVIENIFSRRSCPYKRLKSDPIPKPTLELLLEAANWAPTHRFTEPWRFNVYTGEARRSLANALIEAYRRATGPAATEAKIAKTLDRCLHVPVIVNVAMLPCQKNQLPEYEETLAVGCAMQNFHLAAHALKISGLWSTPGYLEDAQLKQFLQLQDGAKNYGFFYLGYIDDELPQSKRGPVHEKVRWLDR